MAAETNDRSVYECLGQFFGTNNLSDQERQQLQKFFPEDCYFHWDGTGQEPIGSIVVMRGSSALEDACKGCNISPCPVRKAPHR